MKPAKLLITSFLMFAPLWAIASAPTLTDLEITHDLELRAAQADGWLEIYDVHDEGVEKGLSTLLAGEVPKLVALGFEDDLFLQKGEKRVTLKLADYAAFRGDKMLNNYGASCADWAKPEDSLSITFSGQNGLWFQFNGKARVVRHLVYKNSLSDELTPAATLTVEDCTRAYETRMIYGGKLRIRYNDETVERNAVLQYILYH